MQTLRHSWLHLVCGGVDAHGCVPVFWWFGECGKMGRLGGVDLLIVIWSWDVFFFFLGVSLGKNESWRLSLFIFEMFHIRVWQIQVWLMTWIGRIAEKSIQRRGEFEFRILEDSESSPEQCAISVFNLLHPHSFYNGHMYKETWQ